MYSVFIVDDERIIREGLAKFVKWEILDMKPLETAGSVSQALRIATETPPDILITDIRMPGQDGFALINALLEMDQRPQVILISSYDDCSYAQTAVQFDIIRNYVLKPVDIQKLTEILQNTAEFLRQKEQTVEIETIHTPQYQHFLHHLRQKGWNRQKLVIYVKYADEVAALEYWQVIFRLARDSSCPIGVFSRVCFTIIMILVNAGLYDSDRDPIKLLYTEYSYDSIGTYMEQFLVHCCHTANRQSAGAKSKLIESAISQNYCNPDFNLVSLSAQLNVTPNYLSIKFKEETGTGFLKYLTKKQMERAKALLNDPRNKVYAIARDVGYLDEKYFCRVFKKYTGYTPKAWRDKHSG